MQAAVNVVALLSTSGNAVLERNAQGILPAGFNWSEGRTLATPVLSSQQSP